MGNLSTGNGGNSWYDYARRQELFTAYATVTGMVAYSTAAGTGGPLLWNNTGAANGANGRVLAVLIAAGVGISVAATVPGSFGITGNSGQTTAPSANTAIDASGNGYVGGAKPLCNLFRVGTVTNAGNFFQPFGSVGTGALTVSMLDLNWVDLGGSIVVPPGSWASVAASVALATSVLQVGLMWIEVPF